MKGRKTLKWMSLGTSMLMLFAAGALGGARVGVIAICAVCWFANYQSISYEEEKEEMAEPIEQLMMDLLKIADASKSGVEDEA